MYFKNSYRLAVGGTERGVKDLSAMGSLLKCQQSQLGFASSQEPRAESISPPWRHSLGSFSNVLLGTLAGSGIRSGVVGIRTSTHTRSLPKVAALPATSQCQPQFKIIF